MSTFFKIQIENWHQITLDEFFDPHGWTIHGESLYSVITYYCVLQELWDTCLETRLQPDIRSRIIVGQAQMKNFECSLVWFWEKE